MEFPENIAKQLDSNSVGTIRAWRHQMICKLIEAGVVDPEEIKHSVDNLYEFVVSLHKKDEQQAYQQVLINLKRELESPDLQQSTRDTLNYVIGYLAGKQTSENLSKDNPKV